MTGTTHWGAGSIWHHRVLGGLWAICGLVVISHMTTSGRWTDYEFWLASAVALSYVIGGIGFVFGRKWARRTIAALMGVAALFSVDMLLMFGVHGNRAGMWGTLVALGAIVYTLGFLLISAAWHSQVSSASTRTG